MRKLTSHRCDCRIVAHRRSAVTAHARARHQRRHDHRGSRVARPRGRRRQGHRSRRSRAGYQDPHFVEAKPSFILKLHSADLLVRRRPRARDRLAAAADHAEPQRRRSSRAAPGYLDASLTVADPRDSRPARSPGRWATSTRTAIRTTGSIPRTGGGSRKAVQDEADGDQPGGRRLLRAAVRRLRPAARRGREALEGGDGALQGH